MDGINSMSSFQGTRNAPGYIVLVSVGMISISRMRGSVNAALPLNQELNVPVGPAPGMGWVDQTGSFCGQNRA